MKLKKIMAGLLVAAMTITAVPVHNNEQNVVLAAQAIGTVEKYDNEQQFTDYETLKNLAETNSDKRNSAGWGDSGVEALFDNDDNTFWHSDRPVSQEAPIYIQTGFGRKVTVSKLGFLSRPNMASNLIGNYKIEVIVTGDGSDEDMSPDKPADDAVWIPVATGTFDGSRQDEQAVTFEPVQATFIRVTATSKAGGGDNHLASRSIKLYTVTQRETYLADLINKAESEVAAIKTAGQESLYDLTRAEAIIAQAKEAKTDEEKAAGIQLFEETGMNKAIPFEDENGRGLYLSDVEWTSSATGYGSAGVVRDGAHKDSAEAATTALELRNEDGGSTFTTFVKGIGGHATGHVQVDVSDYKKFTSYYGTSGNKTQFGDINYKIFLDGTEATQYRGSSSYNTGMDYWDVDLANAGVLKIAFEQGDNNWSDHAGFGDAKLYTHVVNVPEVEIETASGSDVPTLTNTSGYSVVTQWSVDGSVEAPAQFVEGATYTLTATYKANEGYYFTESSLESWIMTLTQNGATIASVEPTSKEVSTDQSTLTATWTFAVASKVTYNVETQVATGSEEMGTVSSEDAAVAIGKSTILTATPNSSSRFVQWQKEDGTLVSRDAVVTVTPEEDTTYYAVFQEREVYLVNVATKEGVTVTLSDNATTENGADINDIVDGLTDNWIGYVNDDVADNYSAYVQIDLGKVYDNFDYMKMIRLSGSNRKYGPTIIALSETEDFAEPTVIFNSNKGVDGTGAILEWSPAEVLGTGTESLYAETENGREFTIPAGTKAQYVRIYTAGTNSAVNHSQHIYEVEVWAKDESVVSSNEIEVTAGTSHAESPVINVTDANSNTGWHSNWANNSDVGSDNMHKFWVDFKFNELTWIDGVKTLPSQYINTYGVNGVITAYEVWVKTTDDAVDPVQTPNNGASAADYKATWQANYTKVCEGTWGAQTNGTVWKTASFEPIKATHVRLVVTGSTGDQGNNRHASLKEMRVTTPTTDEKAFFTGGALRMDLPYDYTKTFLRFMYQIPATFNGMNIDTDNMWGWRYSVVSAADVENKAVTPVATNKYELDEENGVYKSNIVFKNIGELNYDKPVYTQLVVNYKNASNETLKVYAPVSKRSVKQVAEAIVDAYTDESGNVTEGKEKQVTYANGILWQKGANVQLKTSGGFNGVEISAQDCLYTFEASEDGTGTYEISAMVGDVPVYLNQKNGDAQIPNQTSSAVFTVSLVNNEAYPNTFELIDARTDISGGGYLYFNHDGDYLFNRNSSSNTTRTYYKLYEKTSTVSENATILGYAEVAEVKDGGQYLIVPVLEGQYNNGYYVLHPSNTNNNYDHVAKVIQ